MKNLRLSLRKHPQFHNNIVVNQYTGQMFMKTPGLDLMFPMLVVRHGQTNANINRRFQGQIDTPENSLNDVGKAQAKQAAKQLYDQLHVLFRHHLKEFAGSGKLVILKSPLSRAQDTANAFIEYFKRQTGISLNSHVEEQLAEMCFGALEGLSIEEVKDEKLRESALRYRKAQDATINWEGTGESFFDVVMRANALLEELNAQYHNQSVLVIAFSHGMSINALRTVVGDKALIEADGRIAFRKHIVDNAEAYWLGCSRKLAEQLFYSGARNN